MSHDESLHRATERAKRVGREMQDRGERMQRPVVIHCEHDTRLWRIFQTPILRHLPWLAVRVVRYALPVAVILVALGLLAGLVWVNVWAWGDIANWFSNE